MLFGGLPMKYNSDFDEKHSKRFRITTERFGTELIVTEVGYNTVPINTKQILHRDVYILHYITEGRGIFNHQVFDKHCGYLVVPGEWEYCQTMPEECYEAYWIMFRGAAAEKFLHLCGLPNHSCVFSFDKTQECAKVIKKALDHIDPKNEYEEASLLTAAFFEIIAIHLHDTNHRSNTPPQIARKMKAHMDESYPMTISIEEFAKMNNISRSYLYTLFKREYGVSPKEYLMTLRIQKAKLLFSDQSQHPSVSEVAYAVGFNDPLYFSRVFRKITGTSPSNYSPR
jgi:AraC family transcriptional regulator of arabinose operon